MSFLDDFFNFLDPKPAKSKWEQEVKTALTVADVQPVLPPEPTADDASPYTYISFEPNLSSYGAFQKSFQVNGKQLLFLRDGSTPGIRLDIPGFNIKELSPGDRVKISFSSLTLAISKNSAIKGRARLLAIKEGADFEEYQKDSSFRAVDITGGKASASTGNIYSVGNGASPSFLVPGAGTLFTIGAVTPVQGFKKLKVFIASYDLSVGQATAFTITPWIGLSRTNSSGVSFTTWFPDRAKKEAYSGVDNHDVVLFNYDFSPSVLEGEQNIFFGLTMSAVTGGTTRHDVDILGVE
jgi:hypothetical protein